MKDAIDRMFAEKFLMDAVDRLRDNRYEKFDLTAGAAERVRYCTVPVDRLKDLESIYAAYLAAGCPLPTPPQESC